MDMVQAGYSVVLVEAGDIVTHKKGFETPVYADSILISKSDLEHLLKQHDK